MIKEIFIIASFLCLIFGCSNIAIDFANANKRSYDLIQKEKIAVSRIKVKTFETDTTINFKTVKEITSFFGPPDEIREVIYHYPSPNVLWLLEGPLPDIKECEVLMYEWKYKEKGLLRVVLFVRFKEQWNSVSNLLYDSSLEF